MGSSPRGSGSTRRWRKLRQRVLERDEWTCAYCGRPANQVDHIVPRLAGGPDDEANLGQNPEDYYYVDEKGNLIDPSRRQQGGQDGSGPGRPEDNGMPPEADGGPPPAAASDDFLNQATGRQQPPPRGPRGN